VETEIDRDNKISARSSGS